MGLDSFDSLVAFDPENCRRVLEELEAMAARAEKKSQPPERLITLDRARAILGKKAAKYTDAQLEKALNLIYTVATVAYDDVSKP